MDEQQIQEIQIQQILKQFILILSKNYSQTFSILKSSYYSLPTIIDHKVTIMCKILHHYSNDRKRQLFKHLQNHTESNSYWKIKGVLLMMPVINKNVNSRSRIGFMNIKIKCDELRMSQFVLNSQISKIVYYVKKQRQRTLEMGFSKMKQCIKPNCSSLAKSGYNLWTQINLLYRKRLNIAFKIFKNNNFEINPQNTDKQQKNTENTQQMIKTILVCLNRQQNKSKSNSITKTSQLYAIKIMTQCIAQKQQQLKKQGLDSIIMDYYSYYDQQLIQKLQTEIEVLQQQIDI